jgi:hypothetical protein
MLIIYNELSMTNHPIGTFFVCGEELHDVVSEYGDIVFGLQSGKQKFLGFGLTIIG